MKCTRPLSSIALASLLALAASACGPLPEGESPTPEANEPEAKEPEANEPEANEPEANEPEANEPEANEPEVVVEPEANEPEANEPEANEPEANEPEANEPEVVVEPEENEPEVVVEPEPTVAPFDLDSLTRPSYDENDDGELIIHQVSDNGDDEDWFAAKLSDNNQVVSIRYALVCEGDPDAVEHVRAQLYKGVNAQGVGTIGCGEDAFVTRADGEIRYTENYSLRVFARPLDATGPEGRTAVRYNIVLGNVFGPLPTEVTGVEADLVELLEESDVVAPADFDSITRPNDTEDQDGPITHAISLEGDDEDWFRASLTTNNQQWFIRGTLTCNGIEGTPSPSPVEARLYKNDEPTSYAMFCNQTENSALPNFQGPAGDVYTWRVAVRPFAVDGPARFDYVIE